MHRHPIVHARNINRTNSKSHREGPLVGQVSMNLQPAQSRAGASAGAPWGCWRAPAQPSTAGTDHSQSLTTNDLAALVVDFAVFAALSKNERDVSIFTIWLYDRCVDEASVKVMAVNGGLAVMWVCYVSKRVGVIWNLLFLQ